MLSEKQSTNRSPLRPIEVSYVSSDVSENTGVNYQFNLPTRWTSQQSTNKMIGLRRLKYTPWSGSIGFTVEVVNASGEAVTSYAVGPLRFTSDNNLQECIVAIAEAASFSYSDGYYVCYINYDDTTLSINYTYETQTLNENTNALEDVSTPSGFKLYFHAALNQSSDNFLKLFNQEITDANTTSITSEIAAGSTMTFTNVWNRQDLYFHASFSDSTRQIIGCNNDFWQEPSVFYSAALNSNTFTLRFTQDTVTTIIPHHGVLLVQFSLIFNCLRYLD